MRTALFLLVLLQASLYVVTIHLECSDCICTIANWSPDDDDTLAVDWIVGCEMDLYFVNITKPTILLDQIDQKGLVNKIYINVLKSPIQHVYLSSRAKIFRLVLIETNLSDIRFENQSFKLEYLTIMESRIRTLPESIKFLSNVRTIDILKSPVKFVDFSIFSKLLRLEHIRLGRNEIESLQFPNTHDENFVNLKDIYLSYNLLITVNMNYFNSMKALETLDLSNNRIMSLEGRLESSSLRKLDLSNNRFAALSCCDWNVTGLTDFNAINNTLVRLPNCMETTMPSVSHLQLSWNVLSDGDIWYRLATMNNLQMLDVCHNRLTSLVWCSSVLSLRFLNIRNNSVKQLSVPFAKEGSYVDARCNAVEQFDPSSVSRNVSFLQMQCNPLDCSWNREFMGNSDDVKCVKSDKSCETCLEESEPRSYGTI